MVGALLASRKYELATKVLQSMTEILNARPAFFDDILPDLFTKILFVVVTAAGQAYKAAPTHPFAPSPQTTTTPSIPEDVRQEMLSLRNIGINFLTELFESAPSKLLKVVSNKKPAMAAFLEALSNIMITFKPSPTWETDEEVPSLLFSLPVLYLLLQSIFSFLFLSPFLKSPPLSSPTHLLQDDDPDKSIEV